MGLELDRYRIDAARFCEELSREHYLHLAGHKLGLDIEPIYDRYAWLFDPARVAELRELAANGAGEEGRRLRYLLHFAFDGVLGRASRAEAEEIARLEASLEVDGPGGAIPYRAVPIEQGNETNTEGRAALEEARNSLVSERLDPLHRSALERSHELCRSFGWASYAAAYAELRAIDLEALARQTAAFLEATAAVYEPVVAPRLERAGVPPFGELRRSDIPRFFRAADLDSLFPAGGLVDSFSETLACLGIDLSRQPNVHLDTESRPTKSARAFCSTPRVPEEVYLVIAPSGGWNDYRALFHEGGHTEHYASTSAELPFEFRLLGDNSVTESFAFLFEHLLDDPGWLSGMLGIADPAPAVAHARAFKLVMLRRYAAKLSYELELHGGAQGLDRMPERYATLLTEAVRVPWPRASWLDDVDGGFYAACYLRAWALEGRWRRALRERFGSGWFSVPEAGEWLRALWSRGQHLSADELLAEAVGGELDFAELAAEFAGDG